LCVGRQGNVGKRLSGVPGRSTARGGIQLPFLAKLAAGAQKVLGSRTKRKRMVVPPPFACGDHGNGAVAPA